MKIRIGVVGDQQLVLDALCRLIESEFELLGATTCGIDALDLAVHPALDVMLLDISLPSLNGLDLARKTKKINPLLRIMFVTVEENKEYIRKAFEAGASGYVSKRLPMAELSLAIREVAQGRLFISPTILRRFGLEHRRAGALDPARLFVRQTNRQREVLQLVTEGLSNREIGSQLHISARTVEHHKKRMRQELNLRPAQLIRYGVESALLQV